MLFFFFFASFSSLSFIPSTQKIARKKHHAHLDCSCIPVLPDLVLWLYEAFSVCWYFEMEIMMLYPDFSVTAKKLHSAVNYRLSSTPPRRTFALIGWTVVHTSAFMNLRTLYSCCIFCTPIFWINIQVSLYIYYLHSAISEWKFTIWKRESCMTFTHHAALKWESVLNYRTQYLNSSSPIRI